MKVYKIAKRLAALSLGMALAIPALASAEGAAMPAQATAAVKTDAQTAAELGLLVGDGSGVNAGYLAKGSTRIQAAIISLRLQGKLEEATAFAGGDNFDDAKQVGTSNRAVLAYLRSHPEYGWSGGGGNRFDPLAPIRSQQLYKVLLEALGYRQDADFAYKDTETFAAAKGLTQIAGVPALTNAHIATALVEALAAPTAGGNKLFEKLQGDGVIPASAAMPEGERIGLRTDARLGTFLVDGQGRTLYFFSSDAQSLDACQGPCIANWPLLTADRLQIPASLDPADFTVVTHEGGAKQWTYKGWPLYTFANDAKAGDTLGEGVGGVWYVAKPDYAVMIGANSELGSYLTDGKGRTLYYFDKDMPQMSACEGDCLANWPVFETEGGSVPSALNAADFGAVTRSDGTGQAAFKGYPLYYFAKDAKHGDTAGQNVGGVWFVVDPGEFAGTTAGQSGSAPAPERQPQPGDTATTYHIDIKDFSFGSGPLTVEAGSKIAFTNFDDMKHSAVALDGSFEVPLLAKGESYTITLNKPGTYNYFCEPHKDFMTGQIIVK